MMKRLVFTLIACLLIAGPSFATPTIKLANGLYGTTNGGEFDVTVVSGALGPYNTNDTFYTFCLEKTEYINYGTEYDVLISDAAVYNNGGASNFDPLDERTAYLFTQYVSGDLGTRTNDLADALQMAIWYIEEEITTLPSGTATDFRNAADTAVKSGGEWFGKGLGNVRVMNLFAKDHAGDYDFRKQDQLIIIPAPGAVLLGSLGVCLVGWLRIRRTF